MSGQAPKAGEAGRISLGLVANAAGLVARVLFQFATLPILFAFWDAEHVGTWFLAFAALAYLGLLPSGLAAAAGNAALGEAQAGRMDAARADFRFAWLVAVTGTLALTLLAIAAVGWLDSTSDSILPRPLRGEALPVFGWLGLYVLASAQIALLDIPFRIAGKYPLLMLLNALASLVEIAAFAIAMTTGDSIAHLAMMVALARTGMALACYLVARRIAPGILAGGAGQGEAGAARMERVRTLWKPSIAFMLLPVIFGLNIQGYAILVGVFFGPAVLAGFAATRTLARLIDFFTGVSYAMQFYEFGYLGEDRQQLQRRLLATATMVTLLAALAFALALAVAGPWLQALLTDGETAFAVPVALVLVLAGTFRALASNPAALLAARNRITRVTAAYCISSVAALLAAIALAMAGAPLFAIVAMVAFAEASQLLPAHRQAMAELDWTTSDFLAAVASKERWHDLARLWTRLAGARAA